MVEEHLLECRSHFPPRTTVLVLEIHTRRPGFPPWYAYLQPLLSPDDLASSLPARASSSQESGRNPPASCCVKPITRSSFRRSYIGPHWLEGFEDGLLRIQLQDICSRGFFVCRPRCAMFSSSSLTSFDDTVPFVLVREMEKMGAAAWSARVEDEGG
jgi:hypothetical protein